MSFATWAAKQSELLELEQREGIERHVPESVSKLRLASCKIGAFGKSTLLLTRDNAIIPQQQQGTGGEFSNGTPVKLVCPRWKEDKLGVIKRFVSEKEVEVTCKEGEEPSFEHDITLVSLPDESTVKRVNKALQRAAAAETGTGSQRFTDILFGDAKPRFDTILLPPNAQSMDSLNAAQKDALAKSLAAKDVCVIWGPPGTGKTHTLSRLLEALLSQRPESRVLCVAPSNVAVDNLLSVLIKNKRIPRECIVRLGHPARVDANLHEYTLDSILANSDVAALVLDAKNELAQTRDRARKQELRQEIKSRERAFVRDLFSSRCRIVMSTISSSAQLHKFLPNNNNAYFSTLIVDECGQATEASVWVPMQYLDPQDGLLILAGDHKQLPPTVLSQSASEAGLGSTMMDRLMAKHEQCSAMLLEQYRMCEDIMAWSGREMYQGKLVAHDSVRARTLADLFPNANALGEDADLFGPLLMIDTAGCDSFAEEEEGGGGETSSKTNLGEVELVVQHVNRLLALGLSPTQIAVISPYKGQVNLIKERVAPKVEVRSVDGFQGQERDVVILSMVRSNAQHEVGFLRDERRLNVAITRAKRHVCMIGDSSTLESNAMLKSLIAHFEAAGQVRSADEFKVKPSRATAKLPSAAAATKKAATAQLPASGGNKAGERKKPPVKAATQPKPHPVPVFAKPAPQQQPGGVLQSFAALAVAEDSEEEEEQEAVPQPVIPKPKPVAKTKVEVVEEENEDDFLDRLVQRANNCCFESCTTKTTMIGHDCSFCKQRFCLKHRQPELHGCGKQAKRTAMAANYSKAPPLRASERSKLQEKLKSKIDKETKERTAAVKQKSKSKA